MKLALSLFVLFEILTAILGVYSTLRKKNYTLSESYCYSVILIFAIYSLFIQIFFMVKIHHYYYLFDIVILTFSIIQIWRNKESILLTYNELVQFYKDSTVILWIMTAVAIYLSLEAFFLPPGNWDSMTYNLARVLMMQEEGSLFLKNFVSLRQVNPPWGYDILHFTFLRFYSDYGLGIFSFLSYTIIIVGTYGVVNKIYGDKRLSLISAFIIASLTELVLQATSTKNDIPTAAVSVTCILAGYNFIRFSRYMDFYIIIVSLLFGLSVKGYFPGFAVPFLFFYTVLLIKEYSFKGRVKVMGSGLEI